MVSAGDETTPALPDALLSAARLAPAPHVLIGNAVCTAMSENRAAALDGARR